MINSCMKDETMMMCVTKMMFLAKVGNGNEQQDPNNYQTRKFHPSQLQNIVTP